MSEQLIISVGREYGSGGHKIAEMLSKKFDLPLYDRNLLEEIAAHRNVDVKELEKYDELPKKRFLSRSVRGYSNSPEEIIANMQFEYIKNKAAQGESFVVVGRCAESVLREYKGLVSIFVLADRKCKVERIMDIYHISEEEAESKMNRHDRNRKAYHNHFSTGKWGDSRNYDISMNSSRLGLERTADMLEDYIRERSK
ncbi:MAG: cytidylate kinase-like family protein [Lachnospiraceae bacterium]|nr:cytidylate kinase-like family protein [Lachnospiraceae bacterium]